MAVVGVVILAIFIFMALGSPLITPYNPQAQVSGRLAQPDWVTNFQDGYYLSRNLAAPASGSITSPSSIQAWTLSASPSALANLEETYVQGVTSGNVGSNGSVRLTYTGGGQGTFSLAETFQFPYHGPPDEFYAHLDYMVQGASASTPVWVRVFVQRAQQPSPKTFFLLNENETVSDKWLPSVQLDSNNLQFVNLVDQMTGIPSTSSPQQIIFSADTSYTYGIMVTFFGHQSINIDNIQLQLYGTAFGLLGTDNRGFDVFSETVYGSRISLFVGLLSAAIGIGLGLVVGLLAGFLGRLVDEALMRFTDMMLVIPGLPLLIVLISVLGANIWNVIIVIGFLGWMGFARIIRSQVLTLRERPFIEAAKASGAGPGRIMTKHIFPNIVSLTYVNLALSVPGAILTEAALAFLGLTDPSAVSWGRMFEQVQESGNLAHYPPTWWWVLPPGFGIALVSLSFILVGYALDEVFNPRLRKRR